jgi:hypothetical protein
MLGMCKDAVLARRPPEHPLCMCVLACLQKSAHMAALHAGVRCICMFCSRVLLLDLHGSAAAAAAAAQRTLGMHLSAGRTCRHVCNNSIVTVVL